MNQFSKESKVKTVTLLENSLRLYKDKKFQECLKKYEEILGIISPTDNNVVEAVLFTLISQVRIKIAKNESTISHTSEERDLLKLLNPINQLSKTNESASNQIEDTDVGSPELSMDSGQIEDPPIGIIQLLIKIFGN